jgi:DNA adenine methylase
MSKNSSFIRPFLKWAGGKRQLLEEIRQHIPKSYGTYYEPFVGGGAVLLSLQPNRAIVGDSNRELINCYEVVRDDVDNLIELLKEHERKNSKDYFYKIRELDRQAGFRQSPNIVRAARLIYLNKTCFNGLFRVNSLCQFNVPFGSYKSPKILDEIVLRSVSKYLNESDIIFNCGDFEVTLSTASYDDFVYIDPPYDPISETASFTGYDVGGFGRAQQERLKDCIDRLKQKGCYLLMSNASTDFINQLYSEYSQKLVLATRAINSVADRRGKIDEILIFHSNDCKS